MPERALDAVPGLIVANWVEEEGSMTMAAMWTVRDIRPKHSDDRVEPTVNAVRKVTYVRFCMAKANIPKTRTVVIPKASVLWFPTQFREQQLLDNLDHVEREVVRVEIEQSTHLSL